MGNNPSRVVGCFVSSGKADLDFLDPLDDGLGHSFCYVRPVLFDSPAITPSNSERFTVDSSTLDSETLSGSFRHDSVEDAACLHRPNKCFPETTFRTISGASVSANVSTARTGNHNALFSSDTQEPAASFESTASFAAIPLQPLPRGSGPLNLNGFMSGPLERGFASGPLDKGGGFMSGPIEKGVMSGPLDIADKSNFSAPLAHGGRRRPGLKRFMRSVSGPMRSTLSRTFTRNSYGSGWMQRFFLRPVTQLPWNSRELKIRTEVSRNFNDGVPLEVEYRETQDLQWAHGKAGEDRVHVVLSEEQGWLFIGIYDGFSGPDAPDFLMTHLYRAIDKEMGGLLWDCEENSDDSKVKTVRPDNDNVKHVSEGSKQVLASDPSQIRPFGLQGITNGMSSNCEQSQDGDEAKEIFESPACDKPRNLGTASVGSQEPTLACQGRKSKRLYELLQMEAWDGQSFKSVLHEGSDDRHGSLDVMCSEGSTQGEQSSSCSLNLKASRCIHLREELCTSGKDNLVGSEANDHSVVSSISRQMSTKRKSILSSKIRTMYRKQKSLRKKLFPWSYDWHREDAHVKEKTAEPLGASRRCKSRTVDHDAVLRAMSRALQNTEEAYMEMVEQNFDRNPELALMGSCVLVMLMKDQDVYVMNLGDSRAVLAQEKPNDHHLNLNLLKDDMRNRNRSRESLVRMELDRISEESPVHNQTCQANKTTKSKEILVCGLKMRAIQLSADHSTSVEEEILRIKEEHLDDNQAILNDRVKGQLKVTRAFGAGFLKKPQCNNGLLEMFRIEYVGTAPYVSCIPFIHHHRLSSNDRFLVLSSDGLYQYFSNEEVVTHVTWFMENIPEGDPAQYLVSELLNRAAKKNGMDFHELLDIPHGDRHMARPNDVTCISRMVKQKNFRKRSIAEAEEEEDQLNNDDSEDRRLALEEVKFLQKQRERKSGIPAVLPALQSGGVGGNIVVKISEKNDGGAEGEKDDLVLQDTFAQETAVMVEDPNMLKYVEQQLAKKRGKNIEVTTQAENDLNGTEDELYKIPEHLKVKKRNSEESSTQWTTGIAEIQLPIEYKLKNIEETEAAKKLLQDKRLMERSKTESSIPSSYSADYFQRGRDYAEKLRREHPELYKDKGSQDNNNGARPTDNSNDGAGRREAATDQFMLERFRKRERHRVMRR